MYASLRAFICTVMMYPRAFFHYFGTMTHTPGIGNFSAKMPKIGIFEVLLALLSNHKIHKYKSEFSCSVNI